MLRRRFPTKAGRLLLAALGALGFLLAACGSSGTPSPPGALIVRVGAIPPNLNGALQAGSGAVSRQIGALILPRAFYLNQLGNFALDTRYFSSAEVVSVDPQVVVYKINPSATWSDGHPLSALDLIYTWESQRSGLAGDTPSFLKLLLDPNRYKDVSSVESNANGSEATVKFSKSDANWRSLFSPILSARYMQQNGFVAAMSLGKTGFPTTGGYAVTRYQSDEVVLSALPGSGSDFASVDFVAGGSVASVGASSPSISAAQALDAPANGSVLVHSPKLYQLVFNLSQTSVAFRRGVALAIDRTQLYQNLYSKSVLADSRFYPPGSNLYAQSQAGYEDNQGGYYAGNFALSQRDFFIAGLSFSAGGYLEPVGGALVVTLVFDSTDPTAKSAAALIAAQLRYAGLDVAPVPVVGAAALSEALSQGSYTLALRSVDMSGDPGAIGQSFVSGELPSANISGDFVPDPSQILAQGAQQIYPIAAAKTFGSFDALLWQDMACLPLFDPPGAEIVTGKLSPTQLAGALAIATAGGYETSQPMVLPSD